MSSTTRGPRSAGRPRWPSVLVTATRQWDLVATWSTATRTLRGGVHGLVAGWRIPRGGRGPSSTGGSSRGAGKGRPVALRMVGSRAALISRRSRQGRDDPGCRRPRWRFHGRLAGDPSRRGTDGRGPLPADRRCRRLVPGAAVSRRRTSLRSWPPGTGQEVAPTAANPRRSPSSTVPRRRGRRRRFRHRGHRRPHRQRQGRPAGGRVDVRESTDAERPHADRRSARGRAPTTSGD